MYAFLHVMLKRSDTTEITITLQHHRHRVHYRQKISHIGLQMCALPRSPVPPPGREGGGSAHSTQRELRRRELRRGEPQRASRLLDLLRVGRAS